MRLHEFLIAKKNSNTIAFTETPEERQGQQIPETSFKRGRGETKCYRIRLAMSVQT
jgi:hypothetical protein